MELVPDKRWSLENEYLSVQLLPELGGKISSLYYKPEKFELLCPPLRPFQTAEWGDTFEEFDLCGLDDLFPCIDSEPVETGGCRIMYPDHGEIWSAGMEAKRIGEAICLSYQSNHLPYRYQKMVSLEDRTLRLDYRIAHTGGDAFPCLWTFHGLVRQEKAMKLIYPRGIKRFENVFASSELGDVGKLWNPAECLHYDFCTVPEQKTMVKYYAEHPVSEGSCGYRYPQGVDCMLEYDAEKLPYLGFWVCSGELRGAEHCAFEPSNGYYDAISIAQHNGRCPILAEKDVWEFTLHLCLQSSMSRSR